MRTGHRKFVQARPNSMLHASPIYNVNQPACKSQAKQWFVRELTATVFDEVWRKVGYCQECQRIEPTYFLVYQKMTYEWSLE